MTSAETTTAADGAYCFGKREDIIQVKRVVKLVNGRDIVVLYHEGEFYALDVHCYRKDDQHFFRFSFLLLELGNWKTKDISHSTCCIKNMLFTIFLR